MECIATTSDCAHEYSGVAMLMACTNAGGTCNVYGGASSYMIPLFDFDLIIGVSGSARAYFVITGEDCVALCSGVSHTDVNVCTGTIVGATVLNHGKGVYLVHPSTDPSEVNVVWIFPTAVDMDMHPLCRRSW